jgi:hypothetical protein
MHLIVIKAGNFDAILAPRTKATFLLPGNMKESQIRRAVIGGN